MDTSESDWRSSNAQRQIFLFHGKRKLVTLYRIFYVIVLRDLLFSHQARRASEAEVPG